MWCHGFGQEIDNGLRVPRRESEREWKLSGKQFKLGHALLIGLRKEKKWSERCRPLVGGGYQGKGLRAVFSKRHHCVS